MSNFPTINTPILSGICRSPYHSTEYGPRLTTHSPNQTNYTYYLRSQGFEFPSDFDKTCNGYFYTNVWGKRAQVFLAKPIALVTYTPHKTEKHYQTHQRAKLDVPSCGDWQIINLKT